MIYLCASLQSTSEQFTSTVAIDNTINNTINLQKHVATPCHGTPHLPDPFYRERGWTVWPWENASLLFANMSIANTFSRQLKTGKGPTSIKGFRGDGGPA